MIHIVAIPASDQKNDIGQRAKAACQQHGVDGLLAEVTLNTSGCRATNNPLCHALQVQQPTHAYRLGEGWLACLCLCVDMMMWRAQTHRAAR